VEVEQQEVRRIGRIPTLRPAYDAAMATIHISEDEAARDFTAVLDHVRAGDEVVIGAEDKPVAVVKPPVKPPAEPRGRRLSESIAMAKAHAERNSYEPVMDAEFAADMEEIIRNRKPRDTSAWD
jgi:antitoxin (DNA-binding transcriptional repressor) of toxin-antitoxin stability system